MDDNLKNTASNLKDTSGLEALFKHNSVNEIDSFFSHLQKDKICQLKLAYEQRAEQVQSLIDSNYYRYNIKQSFFAITIFGLIGNIIGWFFGSYILSFILTNRFFISAFFGLLAVSLVNIYDCCWFFWSNPNNEEEIQDNEIE